MVFRIDDIRYCFNVVFVLLELFILFLSAGVVRRDSKLDRLSPYQTIGAPRHLSVNVSSYSVYRSTRERYRWTPKTSITLIYLCHLRLTSSNSRPCKLWLLNVAIETRLQVVRQVFGILDIFGDIGLIESMSNRVPRRQTL